MEYLLAYNWTNNMRDPSSASLIAHIKCYMQLVCKEKLVFVLRCTTYKVRIYLPNKGGVSHVTAPCSFCLK